VKDRRAETTNGEEGGGKNRRDANFTNWATPDMVVTIRSLMAAERRVIDPKKERKRRGRLVYRKLRRLTAPQTLNKTVNIKGQISLTEKRKVNHYQGEGTNQRSEERMRTWRRQAQRVAGEKAA